jgi:hypothetical protein
VYDGGVIDGRNVNKKEAYDLNDFERNADTVLGFAPFEESDGAELIEKDDKPHVNIREETSVIRKHAGNGGESWSKRLCNADDTNEGNNG